RNDALDAQSLKSDACADNVYNRIHRADFVKVNLLDGNVVNLRFGFTDALEDSLSALLDRGVERRGFNQALDLAQRTVTVFMACSLMAVSLKLVVSMLVA